MVSRPGRLGGGSHTPRKSPAITTGQVSGVGRSPIRLSISSIRHAPHRLHQGKSCTGRASRLANSTFIHINVYSGVVSRTNIEIDDELVAAAQRMYRLDSKRSAVDLALRRLVGEPLGRDEALALQGSGFDFSNDEIESFSDTDRKLADES